MAGQDSHHHDHHAHEAKPLGNGDVVAGLVSFLLLYVVVTHVAGPDGYGFLRGLLTEQLASELLVSGCLILLLWCVCAPLFVEPYLQAFYEREEKTAGMTKENALLREQLATLKRELSAEVRNAKLEGMGLKAGRIAEAKRQATQVVETGRAKAEAEWESHEQRLATSKSLVMSDASSQIPALADQLVGKVTAETVGVIH